MQLVQNGYRIQTETIATSSIIFGPHMNILLIIKVNIYVLIKCVT